MNCIFKLSKTYIVKYRGRISGRLYLGTYDPLVQNDNTAKVNAKRSHIEERDLDLSKPISSVIRDLLQPLTQESSHSWHNVRRQLRSIS